MRWSPSDYGRPKWVDAQFGQFPLTFITVMALGGILGTIGINLPFVETGIVISVLTLEFDSRFCAAIAGRKCRHGWSVCDFPRSRAWFGNAGNSLGTCICCGIHHCHGIPPFVRDWVGHRDSETCWSKNRPLRWHGNRALRRISLAELGSRFFQPTQQSDLNRSFLLLQGFRAEAAGTLNNDWGVDSEEGGPISS